MENIFRLIHFFSDSNFQHRSLPPCRRFLFFFDQNAYNMLLAQQKKHQHKRRIENREQRNEKNEEESES